MAQKTMVGRDAGGQTERPRAAAPPALWRRPPWRRVAAAVGAGLLIFLAFPPDHLSALGTINGWWPLAIPGVALFALAVGGVRSRTGAWLGLVTGLAFFLPLLDWARVIGPDAWAGLSLVEALYFMPMGAAAAVVVRLRGWPVWTACLWVAEELVRGRWPLGGLPWGRLAFSQTASPLTPYASLGGAPLVSFVTALAGGLLALAVLRSPLGRRLALPGFRQGGGTVWAAPAALAGIAVLLGGGLAIPAGGGGHQVTVAVVQGNVPRLGLDFDAQRAAVLDNHVRRTLELAEQIRAGKVVRPQLVVWPENASDLDPYTDPEARAKIDAAVRAVGVPVLVGAVIDAPDNPDTKVQNRGIVWDPVTGPGAYYTKRHPVPFGEYVPFREVLTKFISRLDRVPRDFEPGHWAGNLTVGPARVGDVICFEVAYDGIVRDVSGSQLLVVQTNNATYGHTSEPWQQVAMSRLRAVEHDRTVLVAATSGVSAVIAPDGRVVHRSAEFAPDIEVTSVTVRTSRTLADRLGSSIEWALAVVGVGALVVAVRGGLGRTRVAPEAAVRPDADENEQET